jgi:hypothetical protein
MGAQCSYDCEWEFANQYWHTCDYCSDYYRAQVHFNSRPLTVNLNDQTSTSMPPTQQWSTLLISATIPCPSVPRKTQTDCRPLRLPNKSWQPQATWPPLCGLSSCAVLLLLRCCFNIFSGRVLQSLTAASHYTDLFRPCGPHSFRPSL